MLPIIEEIKLDTFNTIHIGQSIDGTYTVTINWCTGTAGGGSHPSVWDAPVRDYKEAVRQGIRLLEQQYNKAEHNSDSDRGNYNPNIIRNLKGKLLEIKRQYTGEKFIVCRIPVIIMVECAPFPSYGHLEFFIFLTCLAG